MAKYKKYNSKQMAMVALNLETQIEEGSLEWIIREFIDNGLDTSIFDDRFKNDETGRTAYDPKILLKIILLGYARGMRSSRELERACKENVTFMSMACEQTPDHTTIAKFVSSMQKECTIIFRDILMYCEQEGLLGGTSFAIDGCKISSNASKEKSGTFEQLKEKKKRLEKRLKKVMYEHQVNDKSQNTPNRKKKAERKAKDITREIKKLNQFLEKNDPKEGKKRKEIQSNTTDNDSSLMKTSKGTIQGYNAQILVDSDHQIILHADPGTGGNDGEHFAPLFDGARKNLEEIKSPIDITKSKALCDASYYSSENLEKCRSEEIDVYSPENGIKKKDPEIEDNNHQFTIVNFEYDKEKDEYICPAGKKLKRKTDQKRNGVRHKRSYKCTADCQECEYAEKCLVHKKAKQRYVNVFYEHELAEFALDVNKKMLTTEGRKEYDQRIGIVEPVFANMCFHKKFNKFLLRGREKVKIEWMLISMVHNLEKILHFGKNIAFGTA